MTRVLVVVRRAGRRRDGRAGDPRAGARARAGRALRGDAGRAPGRARSTTRASSCSRPRQRLRRPARRPAHATTSSSPSSSRPSSCATSQKLPDPLRGRPLQPAHDRAARGARRRRRARASRASHGASPASCYAQCAAADFIICASEKQRDLWLGGLGLSGLIDLDSYRRDRTYRAFVDVVPFGLRDAPPSARPAGAQGRLAGHRRRRPGAAVGRRHLALAGRADPDQGGRAAGRPRAGACTSSSWAWSARGRPQRRSRRAPSEAIAYARERGLEGTLRPLQPRLGALRRAAGATCLEADLGISAHHDHLEARFSFRTRVLDYLWAGLPMVLTRGDSMAELAERRRASAPPSTPRTARASPPPAPTLLDDPAAAGATARG